MPIDRAATLRNAEKLLRQGKLEPAIAEYLRIVDDQPRDWSSANALGDLYVRAGQAEKGIEQFVRVADALNGEGFLPKAAALYKKILKLRPEHEHALMQAAEIAASQGVLVDARSLFRQVEQLRAARGDARGAAEARIRRGGLDAADYEGRKAAAAARIEIGDSAGGVRDLREIAADLAGRGKSAEAAALLRDARSIAPDDDALRTQLMNVLVSADDFGAARECAVAALDFRTLAAALEGRGREPEALAMLCEAARLDDSDVELRSRLARTFVARGDIQAAAEYLTETIAGTDEALLLTLAEIRLRRGELEGALAIARRLLEEDASRRERLAQLAAAVAPHAPDEGFKVAEIAADAAVEAGDWPAAARVLQQFSAAAPAHVPTLLRLVELCVDGDLGDAMQHAQAKLADAYLQAGMAAEARFIAEDLVAQEPWDRANLDRLRRALVLMNEPDPDAAIADRLSGQAAFDAMDLCDLEAPAADAAVRAPSVAALAATAHAIDIERFLAELEAPPRRGLARQDNSPRAASDNAEVDLSVVIADMASTARPAVVQPAAMAADDLDGVFEQLRDETSRRALVEAAEAEYKLALHLREAGDMDACMAALQSASRAPALRFPTASLLGRMHRDRGALPQAIEWFERAAQAPAPTAVDYHELLFELGESLERSGESTRALAVFLELQADAGAFRDVDARVDRLSKVQARG